MRYAIRSLLKSPGVTAISILALTLGIGLTTTMFTLVYGAVLRGLPYPDGDRIVEITESNVTRGILHTDPSIQDFLDFRAQQHSFNDLAASTSGTIFVSGDEKAERFQGSWISANTFSVVGVRPILGRDFRPGEDTPAGEKVAILAYSTWQERYRGDSSIIGRTIRVNGAPTVVVGVMPQGFAFPNEDKLWLPLQVDPLASERGKGPTVAVFGKLKPRVSIDQASVDIATIAQRLARDYPEANGGFAAVLMEFVEYYIGPEPGQLLYTMLGAVFFVLLIACANVANLLLDRAAHRTKEIGIRTALGASRATIMRQFLIEALLLSAVAAILGTIAAHFGVAVVLRAITSEHIPFFMDFRLHLPVLLFAIAVTVVTTLASGAIPAIQSARADINAILKDESRGASSFRVGRISRMLVIVEVALSCGLLVAAGLTIKSVTKLRTMNPGFVGDPVLTARVGFPTGYADTLSQWRFFDNVLERVAALPGVQHAALSSGLPASQSDFNRERVALEGESYVKDTDYPPTRSASVTPDFFATLGIPILQGRAFDLTDRADAPPVATVNKAFVDKFFQGRNPIGKRIRLGGADSKAPWMTIVGIVGNVFTGDNVTPMQPAVFQPFLQARVNFVYIAAKTTGAPLTLARDVREAVAAENPDIPVYWVETLTHASEQSLWFVRVFGTMFVVFGIIALFLAAVGLYAVMSFSVARRTREVGIRMALGAQARDVIGMIFNQGARQLGIGMVLGLALAFALSSVMSIVLFDVQPHDASIFLGVVAVLIAVGLAACLLPARRATRIDPLVALRSD